MLWRQKSRVVCDNDDNEREQTYTVHDDGNISSYELQGRPKKLPIFQHIMSLEPLKIKWRGFNYNVQKISMMKNNYKFLWIYCIFFVTYAYNYHVISDNLHKHASSYCRSSLGWSCPSSGITRHSSNRCHCLFDHFLHPVIYNNNNAKNWSNWQWHRSLEWRAMPLLGHDQQRLDWQCDQPVSDQIVLWWSYRHMALIWSIDWTNSINQWTVILLVIRRFWFLHTNWTVRNDNLLV